MKLTRRRLIQSALATAAAGLPASGAAAADTPATRPIPSTGERLPLVGLGSWVTFNVGADKQLLDESAAVIAAFFEAGGRLIDSSPMYGSAQTTIGYALAKLGRPKQLFSADKVWISNPSRGPRQIEQSRKNWRVPRFDLVQVHNLLSWQRHLETLQDMKRAGRVRYIGITTSHGRRHRDVEHILSKHPIDFVQVTYNAIDREVEQRILPLAKERGVAVIANRPFRRRDLIEVTRRHPLPAWAAEAGAKSWAQFLLRFIISHPAVTCAIPATTRVDHVRENLATATADLPGPALRRRMAAHVASL
jgi:diketogulonate reductase-like aldo/keto reductase